MTIHIRMLNTEDIPLLESMHTGIEHDYILRIAGNLMAGANRLFGLFADETLVSFGGYTIFADHYAMLGRLRSDRRYTQNGYATRLMYYIRDAAFQIPQIQWAGANTQEGNFSARRVLEKINFHSYTTLHGALTDNVRELAKEASPWQEVTDNNRKREWLLHTYVNNDMVFAYGCYYLFPSSPDLFQDDVLNDWHFYENNDHTRFIITKKDRKKHHYLHISYPWNDIFEQSGLWATVSRDYCKLKKETNDETYIWYDMTKAQAQSLTAGHHWKLPSPWMLYGMDRTAWRKNDASAFADKVSYEM